MPFAIEEMSQYGLACSIQIMNAIVKLREHEKIKRIRVAP